MSIYLSTTKILKGATIGMLVQNFDEKNTKQTFCIIACARIIKTSTVANLLKLSLILEVVEAQFVRKL